MSSSRCSRKAAVSRVATPTTLSAQRFSAFDEAQPDDADDDDRKQQACGADLFAEYGDSGDRHPHGPDAYLRGVAGADGQVTQCHHERAADGDVPGGTDAATIAAFYSAVNQGMAIQARDGADRSKLSHVAEAAIAAWDGLVGAG
jgi:hypothetical protein